MSNYKYNVLPGGAHIAVTSVDNPDVFLNVKYDKKTATAIVENNFTNQLILGIVPKVHPDEDVLHIDRLEKFQIEDVKYMLALNHVCNANRMGLGKTVESIITLRNLDIDNALVIAPKAILTQWKNSIEYWWPNAPKCVIIEDTKDVVPSNCIILINYEKLLNEGMLTKLRGFRWQVVIADEAHKLKNYKSKTFIAACKIPAIRKWALTGTPVINRPPDIYGILTWLDSRYTSRSYWSFVNYYCEVVKGFFGQEIKGMTKVPEHQNAWDMLRRYTMIRNDVYVAPGKNINTIRLQMTPAQRKLYKSVKDLLLEELPDDMTIANGLVQCVRLQQITSDPRQFDIKDHGIKFEFLKGIFEDYTDTSFVVFTRFATTARDLQKFLNVRSVIYTGECNTTERVEALNAFRTRQVRVFIATIGAAGVGLDGLQDVCNTAYFMERDWSPEIMAQAEDRLYRRGQEKIVDVYVLECESTYDQYVGKVTRDKAMTIKEMLRSE